ncbi:hypothetical protein ACFX2B_040927 [Malus domestica]
MKDLFHLIQEHALTYGAGNTPFLEYQSPPACCDYHKELKRSTRCGKPPSIVILQTSNLVRRLTFHYPSFQAAQIRQ